LFVVSPLQQFTEKKTDGRGGTDASHLSTPRMPNGWLTSSSMAGSRASGCRLPVPKGNCGTRTRYRSSLAAERARLERSIQKTLAARPSEIKRSLIGWASKVTAMSRRWLIPSFDLPAKEEAEERAVPSPSAESTPPLCAPPPAPKPLSRAEAIHLLGGA
jgi:hypothetical protein